MNRTFYFVSMILLCNAIFGQPKHYKFKQQIDSILANDTTPWKYQLCACDYSMIGEYRATLKTWDAQIEKNQPLKNDLVNQFLKYHPQHADKYIIEQAQNTSLLIINEAHHQPLHRVFAESILEKLFACGYKYIGFETLYKGDSLLNERKYPIKETGYYSNEPSFGNLIRTALHIGYTIFPYEAKGEANGEQREIEEANNIKFFMNHSDGKGKYIIFCGFSHVIEDSVKNWKLAMTGRLKALTGINPLTVDQVQLTEASSPDFDNPYRELAKVDYPSVFIDSAGNAFNKARKAFSVDLNVYHPDTKYQNGRPNWLYRAGYKGYRIVSQINIDFPCLVFAYNKSENFKGVPVDVISVENKESDKYLILPVNDKIIVVCKNQKGQEQVIEIK